MELFAVAFPTSSRELAVFTQMQSEQQSHNSDLKPGLFFLVCSLAVAGVSQSDDLFGTPCSLNYHSMTNMCACVTELPPFSLLNETLFNQFQVIILTEDKQNITYSLKMDKRDPLLEACQ